MRTTLLIVFGILAYQMPALAIQCTVDPHFKGTFVSYYGFEACFEGVTSYYGPLSIPVACAPETQVDNTKAIEETLKRLASNELSYSKLLPQLIDDYKKADPKNKISGLLRIAEIHSDEELVSFIGAREIPAKQIQAISTKLDVSEPHAELLLKQVSASILGQRK